MECPAGREGIYFTYIILANRQQSETEGIFVQNRLKRLQNCVIMILENQDGYFSVLILIQGRMDTMKRTLALFFAACIMLSSFCVSAFAANGNALPQNAVIFVKDNCSDTDMSAAETLQTYIEQLSGVKHEIVKAVKDESFVLYIGDAAVCKTDVKDLADGSYIIKSVDNGVEIAGAGNRGTLYGTYAFLEKFGGCRWLTSAMGMTSEQNEIILPDTINEKYNAYFEYTETDWRSPCDPEYSVANGLSGGVYRDIPAEQGGTVDYISGFCHTLTTQFCAADTYFDSHPEYFALHGGKRSAQQLCLTSEDTYNIVLNEVLALLEEKHDPDASLQIISLTQNDSGEDGDFCECEKCKAIDDENGSHAGTMITFVNRIAAEVKKRGYDNVAIDTFAYRYTRTTPSAVKPLDNVIVRLCTIECCFSHPLDDPDCPDNVSLMQDLTGWNNICDRLYIWDYTTNYANTLGIFPDFGVIQKNAQIFYEHGVKGVYEEGNYYINDCDTEFGELRAYLLAKCLQDPYCDHDAVMNDFLKGYYGAGWQNIREFIDIISENAAKGHVQIYSNMAESLFLSDEETEKCDELWKKAENECTDETQLANIKRSELSWRFWKASVGKSEFRSLLGGAGDRKTLLADIIAAGTVRASEGGGELKTAPFYQFSHADVWFGGDVGGPTVKLLLLAAWILFGLALVCALILLIQGIRNKKPLFCIPFPLIAASSELALWHRRAYLAWKDLDQYALSLVIGCLVFAFMGFVLHKAKGEKNKKKALLSALFSLIAFIVPYYAATVIINVVLFNGTANQLAIAVAYLLCAVSMFVIELITVKSTIRNKK